MIDEIVEDLLRHAERLRADADRSANPLERADFIDRARTFEQMASAADELDGWCLVADHLAPTAASRPPAIFDTDRCGGLAFGAERAVEQSGNGAGNVGTVVQNRIQRGADRHIDPMAPGQAPDRPSRPYPLGHATLTSQTLGDRAARSQRQAERRVARRRTGGGQYQIAHA